MKKIIIAFVALFMINSAQAQQDPLFAQYNNNVFLINPAIAGSKGNHSINLFHRWQWVTFPGAPMTFGLNYQGILTPKLANKTFISLGALAFGDITGPSSRYGGKIAVAGHIRLAKKLRLSIGIAGRFAYNQVRASQITFIDPNDNAVIYGDRGVGSADLELGIHLYSKNFYVGFAAPNVIQTKIDFGDGINGRDPVAYGYRHYFLNAGYKFRFPEKKMILEPSIMVKYVQGSMPQFDAGLTLHVLDEVLAFGLFYRSPAFLSFQAKFFFDKKIPVVIGFDIALNNFQQYSVGSTELMIGYESPNMDLFGDTTPPKDDEPNGDL